MGFGDVLMLVLLYDRVAEPVRHLHRILDEANERFILARDYLDILSIDPVIPSLNIQAGTTSCSILEGNTMDQSSPLKRKEPVLSDA